MEKSDNVSKYYYTVVGNDMSEARILDGDIVLIDEDYEIHPNDILLVVVQPYSIPVLRKVFEHESKYQLCTASSDAEPTYSDLFKALIIGKVVEVRIPK